MLPFHFNCYTQFITMTWVVVAFGCYDDLGCCGELVCVLTLDDVVNLLIVVALVAMMSFHVMMFAGFLIFNKQARDETKGSYESMKLGQGRQNLSYGNFIRVNIIDSFKGCCGP